MCVFQSLQCIREQLFHLLFTLDKILSAFITHAVFIRYDFAGLDAEQDIMRLCIFRPCIMHIVRCH